MINQERAEKISVEKIEERIYYLSHKNRRGESREIIRSQLDEACARAEVEAAARCSNNHHRDIHRRYSSQSPPPSPAQLRSLVAECPDDGCGAAIAERIRAMSPTSTGGISE